VLGAVVIVAFVAFADGGRVPVWLAVATGTLVCACFGVVVVAGSCRRHRAGVSWPAAVGRGIGDGARLAWELLQLF
jgi:hypothetical protein